MKRLLREVLDPAVEHVQHAKTQRERIHNDNVYFTSSRHPKNAPAWTYKEIHYETDDEIYGEELQNEDEYVREEDDDEYLPVYKRKKNMIFCHPVRLSSGIRQR